MHSLAFVGGDKMTNKNSRFNAKSYGVVKYGLRISLRGFSSVCAQTLSPFLHRVVTTRTDPCSSHEPEIEVSP